ncbi:hypothetical protein NL676_023581 [Syzygium grande]|nr:hypothetical protein NL676_023581 [Syzygium grande]
MACRENPLAGRRDPYPKPTFHLKPANDLVLAIAMSISAVVYRCDFNLHFRCSQLPPTVANKNHRHPFNLHQSKGGHIGQPSMFSYGRSRNFKMDMGCAIAMMPGDKNQDEASEAMS